MLCVSFEGVPCSVDAVIALQTKGVPGTVKVPGKVVVRAIYCP